MKKPLPEVKKKSSSKEEQLENAFPVVAIGASAGGVEADLLLGFEHRDPGAPG